MKDSVPGGTRDLQILWRRFECWIRENAPGDFAALRSGASGPEITILEDGVGFPLHSGLTSLLSVCNGVTPRRSSTEPGAFLLGYSLLAADQILESHVYLVSMARDAIEDGYEEEVIGRTAHPEWVPFAQSLTGDLLFVDHRDEHFGEIGEISFGDPEYLKLWPNMNRMFGDLCDAVENSTGLPTARRSPSIYDNRMVEWVSS
ncbi:SMI1/KNR4 family protein [Streptomyces sp. NPDC002932]|uniref:SMI1/KNR4 family protein n=1 Tax=Streptomyces sp. NPDC002932 TaxID=3364672 RepID=UPI00369020AC